MGGRRHASTVQPTAGRAAASRGGVAAAGAPGVALGPTGDAAGGAAAGAAGWDPAVAAALVVVGGVVAGVPGRAGGGSLPGAGSGAGCAGVRGDRRGAGADGDRDAAAPVPGAASRRAGVDGSAGPDAAAALGLPVPVHVRRAGAGGRPQGRARRGGGAADEPPDRRDDVHLEWGAEAQRDVRGRDLPLVRGAVRRCAAVRLDRGPADLAGDPGGGVGAELGGGLAVAAQPAAGAGGVDRDARADLDLVGQSQLEQRDLAVERRDAGVLGGAVLADGRREGRWCRGGVVGAGPT